MSCHSDAYMDVMKKEKNKEKEKEKKKQEDDNRPGLTSFFPVLLYLVLS